MQIRYVKDILIRNVESQPEMQIILTEEEYLALKAGTHKEPDLNDYRERLERAMFPLVLRIIREAQDTLYTDRDSFLHRITATWNETFHSVPVVKP